MSGANQDSNRLSSNSVSSLSSEYKGSMSRSLAALIRYPEAKLTIEFFPKRNEVQILARTTSGNRRRFALTPTTLEAYSFDALDILSEKMICLAVQDTLRDSTNESNSK